MSQSVESVHLDSNYQLDVRQQPTYARVAIGKEKDRKPIDPPPIVQLRVDSKKDPMQNFLHNPYFMMVCHLIKEEDGKEIPQPEPLTNCLVGNLASSLHCLRDTDNSMGGFFIFGDMSVKSEGRYRLEFTLRVLKLDDMGCYTLATARSDPFTVFSHKLFPGMAESTVLTRYFSDQGVRLRLRKDSRSITTRKRNSTVADFARQYSSHDREQQQHSRDQTRANSLGDATPTTPIGHRGMGALHGGASFFDSSQQYAHGPVSSYPAYGGGYDDRSMKRQRMMSSSDTVYDHHDYTSYQAGPRTLPDMPATSIYGGSSGYAVTSNPAVSGLPLPMTTYAHQMPPRLDTTQLTPQTGPNSASSNFSPGTRRSPGQGYQYQHHQMFQSPAGPMHFQGQSAAPTPPNSLGLGIDLDTVDNKNQHSHHGPTGGPGL